jgi:hypothetical protein
VRREVIARSALIFFLVSALAAADARAERAAVSAPTAARPELRLDPALLARLAAAPPRALALQNPQPQPVEPVHAVNAAPAPATGEPLSLTQKWWFWAAVGGLVVTTLVLVVVATRGSEAPRTRLGNMEAFQ